MMGGEGATADGRTATDQKSSYPEQVHPSEGSYIQERKRIASVKRVRQGLPD